MIRRALSPLFALPLAACAAARSPTEAPPSPSPSPSTSALAAPMASPAPPSPSPAASAGKAPSSCVVYAPVTISTEPLPARFTAPIAPRSHHDAEGPPSSFVEHQLCSLEPTMVARMLEALRSTRPQPYSSPPVSIPSCDARCTLAEKIVESDVGEAGRRAGWHQLTRCKGAKARSLFLGGKAPARELIRWFSGQKSEPPPPGFERTVQKAIDEGREDFELAQIAEELAESRDPRIESMIERATDRLRGNRQRSFALGLRRARSPGLKARFERACKGSDEWRCKPEGGPRSATPGLPEPPAPPATPEDEIRCVEQGEAMALRCIQGVASRDWARARSLLPRLSDEQKRSEPAALLAHFETREELTSELEGLGLSPPKSGSLSVSRGQPHVLVFEPHKLWSRLEYYTYEAADLPGSPLAGIALAEPIRAKGDRREVSLLAYANGKRFELTLEQIADEFLDHADRSESDGGRVLMRGWVGFLNSISRELGSPRRWVRHEDEVVMVDEKLACALERWGVTSAARQ